MRKKIQLLRNENVYTPSEGKTALDNAKTDLSNVVLNDGEIVIGRYQENNENVKTVLGIKHNIEADGQENPVEGMTFFTNSDNFVSKPVVLYQTDGTTGLLGVNPSQLGNDWQLENYDFSPYKYLRCYFKMGNFSTNGVELTPSMVVELPLDIESKSKSPGDSTQEEPKTACDMYIAGGIAPNPSDPTSISTVLVAVDSTKTKFQVINQFSYDEWTYDNNYDNSPVANNNNGRYLYKIEGCSDTLNNSSSSPDTSVVPKTPMVNVVPVSTSLTIEPYKMYDLGTLSDSYTIIFDTSKEESGYVKEYMFRFVAGSTCGITLPSGVIYANGVTPTYVSGHTYEINVINNCAAVVEFY